jgi:hypothetical protein
MRNYCHPFFLHLQGFSRVGTPAGFRKGYAFGTLIDTGKRGDAGWLYDESTTASSAHWKEWG